MKQYFLKLSGALLVLGLVANSAFAQQEDGEKKKVEKSDLIIIHPKEGKDTKVTIEVKDGEVKVNGKPLSEFSDDNVTISKRKSLDAITVNGMPSSRFRSSTWSYNGDNDLFGGGEEKAFLGVSTDKAPEGGAKVTGVSENTAAEKAGLKKGDVIVRVNDQKITGAEDLSRAIGKYKPEEKVTVVYKRDGKEMSQSIALGKRKMNTVAYSMGPGSFNFDRLQGMPGMGYTMGGHGRLGIKAQEIEEGKGVKVLEVDDESPADNAGIKEGDIITEFDGTEVDNVDKLREAASKAIVKPSFKVKLTRDGKSQEIQVKIPRNLKTANL